MPTPRILSQSELNDIAAQNRRYFELNPQDKPAGYQPYQAPAPGVNTFLPTRAIDGIPSNITLTPDTSNQTMSDDNLFATLKNLLERSQREGTKFKAKSDLAILDARAEQRAARFNTPDSLIGASPEQQAYARNAEATSYDPAIQGAQAVNETFQERLQNFEGGIKTTTDYLRAEAQRQDQERGADQDYVFKMLDTFAGNENVWEYIDPKRLKNAGFNPEQINNLKLLQVKSTKDQPASVQEYEYAKANGYKGTFNDYQNLDANRKIKIAQAGLTPYQSTSVFDSIVAKENASPLIQASDRAITLKNSITQAEANPGDGATQLNLIYGYIQALDQYQSAVREGEIALSQGLMSYYGKLENFAVKVIEGRPLDTQATLAMAKAAKQLVDTIDQGAAAKRKQYQAQAEVAGVGGMYDQYRSSYEQGDYDAYLKSIGQK